MDIKDLKALQENLQAQIDKQYEEWHGKVILGFKVIMSKNKGKYTQFVAKKTIEGKQRTVYIGKDPTLAKKKIFKYLKDNNLEKK